MHIWGAHEPLGLADNSALKTQVIILILMFTQVEYKVWDVQSVGCGVGNQPGWVFIIYFIIHFIIYFIIYFIISYLLLWLSK